MTELEENKAYYLFLFLFSVLQDEHGRLQNISSNLPNYKISYGNNNNNNTADYKVYCLLEIAKAQED